MKKNLGPNLVQGGQNRSRNQVFCYFLKFGSLIFFEIAHSDSLQQCLACSRGKIFEKILGPTLWSKGAKIGPKIRFFAIFSSLLDQFSLKLHTVIACSNVQHVVEVKSMKKFWGLNLVQRGQNCPESRFFAISSSLLHQFSLKLYTVIACNNVQPVVEAKSMKKSFKS